MDDTAETMQARLLKLHTYTQQTTAFIETAWFAAGASLDCVTERWKTLKSWQILWPFSAASVFLPQQLSDRMMRWKWNIEALTDNIVHW
jgi:hypothetical protein